MIHLAGLEVRIGSRLRQRCVWCGAVMIDYDLDRVMVAGEWSPPATWPVFALVERDGAVSSIVEIRAGDELPEKFCGRLLPDDVTH